MKQIPRFKSALTLKEMQNAVFAKGEYQSPIEAFEKAFAKYIGASHAVYAPSGRQSLAALLHALGLKKGGEAIFPSLTFHSVPEVFTQFGIAPKFVDIDPSTCCIDEKNIERAITKNTVAIVPVHLYGRACNMEAIMNIAQKHSIAVIEDCAQGCGARFHGKRLGSFGAGSFFSFSAAKNVSTLWGGMAATNCAQTAEGIRDYFKNAPQIGRTAMFGRLIFAAGMRTAAAPFVWNVFLSPALRFFKKMGIDLIENAVDETPGETAEIDRQAELMPRPFQAKLGLSRIEKLDDENERRIANGERLLINLEGTPGLKLPAACPRGENIFNSFTVQVKDRDVFRRRLLDLGVDTHGGNMSVGPMLPGMEGSGEFENAAEVVKQLVHLPVYPELGPKDVDLVAEAVKKALHN